MIHTYSIDEFERHMMQVAYWQTLANHLRQAAKTRNPIAVEALVFDAEQNIKVHNDLANQCRPTDWVSHHRRLLDAKDQAMSDAVKDAHKAIKSQYPSRAATYAQR